jgi:uncharacterized coiled-coil DUF342 family protein
METETTQTTQTTQTSVDTLYHELDELRARNAARKTEISTLRRQIDETAEKRDHLNAEVKQLSGEVKSLKSKRDSLNARVKDLKLKRDELRAQADEKRKTLAKLLEQTRQMSEQLQGNASELSHQIKSLEWYIQTNPLAPKTERSIIGKISALEANLAKHKGLKNVKDKLLQLRIEVGALRIKAQSTHEELTRVAEESEKMHKAMQDLAKTLIEKKREADTKHSQFLEQNQIRREVVDKFRESLERIEQIRSKIGEARESPRLKGEQVKSKYKEAATEKMKTGGKLSFEEFQALMEDSLSDSDKD